MIYIAHRGLMDGPDELRENSPEQIKDALSKGFDVEIDVWKLNNKWFLGHDGPTYETTFDFINDLGVWAHCKNLDALYHFTTTEDIIFCDYFWHQEDDFTLTATGIIWTYPGKHLTNQSIAVVPERCENYWEYVKTVDIYGVCTDYVNKFIDETRTMSVGTTKVS